MKKRILHLLITIVVIGCSGPPPAPVNKYGTATISSSISNYSPSQNGQVPTINNRPPLPCSTSKTTRVKPVIASEKNKGVLSGQEIFKKCNTAVFMIFTSTGYENYQGSGFFISPDGLAVSNYHVFEGTGMGLETITLSNGSEYKMGELIYKDKDNDVIVFTIKNDNGYKFNYISISSRNPQVGDKAYAIGSPRGLENTFSSGEISQLRDDNILQISVPIDHGSSGGALINEYGEVIGITSSGFDDSGANLNFAVNINVVKKILAR